MAPLDRRRPPISSWLLLFFLVFSSTASAASAVLGIDFGTEYIKAVLVKPGIPLDIVLTKDSKRKEVGAIAFKAVKNEQQIEAFPERIYGSDAIALAARIPGDVYPNLKPLLGLQVKRSTSVEEYTKFHPALDLMAQEGRGTVGFKSKAFGNKAEVFAVEELLAMELQNIRSSAEAMAGKGSSIKDVVITIPPFYTAEETRALELAVDLAGLNLLGFMSDGLAVGINYATSRTFPSINEGGKAEHHLILDMGARSTSATVLQFQGRTVKDVGRFNKTIQEVNVLSTGWDRTLGGDELNAVIATQIHDELSRKLDARGIEIAPEKAQSAGRTMAMIWKEAEKLRQVLSANSETSANFESLYGDVDFRYKLSRARFEELTASIAERIDRPIQHALKSANLQVDDLDSIILHGGLTRTPFVQTRLEALVGNPGKIRSNVNADEAAAFGAAFRGAGLSPSFKVKEIRSRDGTAYNIGLQWSMDGKNRRQKIFVTTSQRGVEKFVPLKMLKDFSFVLSQQIPTEADMSSSSSFADSPINKIQTHNLTASVTHLIEKAGCVKENITTGFALKLSPINGLPEVSYGTVSCEVGSMGKKGGVVDEVKGFFGFGQKNDEQKPLKDAARDSTASGSKEDTATASGSASSGTVSPEATAEAQNVEEAKKRIETVYIDFTVTMEGTPLMTTAERTRSKERLSALNESDKARRLRSESLNRLEAFIYRIRDLLTDEPFIAASNEKEREQLQNKLHDASEWLYDGGSDAGIEELKARTKQLKDLVHPIEKRKEEAIKRPKEIELLRDLLNQTKTLADVIAEQVEKSAAEKASSSQEASTLPTSSTDDFADLEDSTTSSSTTATTTTTKPTTTPDLPNYQAEDVSSLIEVYQSVNEWLRAKVTEQDKLSPHEDPVILSEDLAAKAKELNRAVTEILQKRIRAPPPKAKSSSSAKAKTKSSKTKSSKTKSGKSTATSSSSSFLTGTGEKEEVTKIPEAEADSRREENSQAEEKSSRKKGKSNGGHDEL
ncbi:MAG: lumenal Hsp70 protein [Peltula sp. TS41687]|nr:MAG: lumenal Hsp70 protein [Peltula sp. TS41687]